MSDLVLGVDCSTTASKVIAWNRHGKALGEGRASLPEIRPLPLYSEQAAEAWWDATAEALARLTKSITSTNTGSRFRSCVVRVILVKHCAGSGKARR